MGVMWQGLDHSPLCNAAVKNGGAIPPFHHKSSWCGAKLNTEIYLIDKHKKIASFTAVGLRSRRINYVLRLEDLLAGVEWSA
jgi:hypothetical protein